MFISSYVTFYTNFKENFELKIINKMHEIEAIHYIVMANTKFG